MTVRELLIEAEMRRPRDPTRDYAGSLTQAHVDELEAMFYEE